MAKNAAATQKFINTYIHMAYSTHIHFNARSIFCACANHSFTFDTHNMRLTAMQMHVCVYVCARLCEIKRRALKINWIDIITSSRLTASYRCNNVLAIWPTIKVVKAGAAVVLAFVVSGSTGSRCSSQVGTNFRCNRKRNKCDRQQ